MRELKKTKQNTGEEADTSHAPSRPLSSNVKETLSPAAGHALFYWSSLSLTVK